MSKRLQVLVSPTLDRRIRKAAARRSMSAGAWVRDVLEAALRDDRPADALDRLAALGAPTGDLDDMLAEIDAGRG